MKKQHVLGGGGGGNGWMSWLDGEELLLKRAFSNPRDAL